MSRETTQALTLAQLLERAAKRQLQASWIYLPRGFRNWTLATPVLIPADDEDDERLAELKEHCCIYSDRIEGVVTTLASWHGESSPAARLEALKYWCEHDAFRPPPEGSPPAR